MLEQMQYSEVIAIGYLRTFIIKGNQFSLAWVTFSILTAALHRLVNSIIRLLLNRLKKCNVASIIHVALGIILYLYGAKTLELAFQQRQ